MLPAMQPVIGSVRLANSELLFVALFSISTLHAGFATDAGL